MREIKFRAWTNIGSFKEPKNGMVYADLDQLYGGELGDNTHFCGGHAVMQYTGLKDKNGREIYEGDIVAWRSYKGEVYYDKARFWVTGFNCTWQDDPSDAFGEKEPLEVIGDIYSNPDLLK